MKWEQHLIVKIRLNVRTQKHNRTRARQPLNHQYAFTTLGDIFKSLFAKGESGIRTHGSALQQNNRFRGGRFRPLSHLSTTIIYHLA